MKNRLFWFFIISLYFLSRLALIDKIPPGISNDEADNGYEAYSLLKTGKDQWGKVWPITDFLGFGDHRLPVYIYSIIPFEAILGLNSVSIRLPSVVSGVVVLILTYILTRSWFSDLVGKFAVIILVLMPWFWGMTRIAIEPPVALTFILAGTLSFWNAKERLWFYLFSGLLFALAMFSYPGIRLFLPIWAVFLAFFCLKWRARFFYWLGIAIISAGIFLLGSSTRLKQIWVIENPVLVDVANRHLDACRGVIPSTVCRVLENKWVVIGEELTKNYLNHFSLGFIFLESDLAKGLLPVGGLVQKSLFLPIIVGVFFFLRRIISNEKLNRNNVDLVLVWLLASPLADSITGAGHYSRSFVMVFPIALTAGLGFELIWHKWRKISMIIMALFVIESGKFVLDYFTYFPKYHAKYTHYEYKELMDYFKGVGEDEYSNIYLSSQHFDSKQYMFYLYYFGIDPSWYQKSENKDWHDEGNGWIRITRVGGWRFVALLPDINEVPDDSLYIGAKAEIKNLIAKETDQLGKNCEARLAIEKNFYFPDGGDAFWIARVRRQSDCRLNPEQIPAL